jgi:aryl-alcohol dehydrogenase-like predicted oxidoreductase
VHYAETSLRNLGVECLDLFQFHVWEDDWHDHEEWQRAVEDLRRRGLIQGVGISVNTWEPGNVIKTLQTGQIDAVQVIYNVFEQQPEDQLFPYCKEHDIAIIARVPFDEGSLTGAITLDTTFDADDWRASYFVGENLRECVPRVQRLRDEIGESMALPEFALRFVLAQPAVSTVIPGMRRPHHVDRNMAVSDMEPFSDSLLSVARRHRWDRTPTAWSQ